MRNRNTYCAGRLQADLLERDGLAASACRISKGHRRGFVEHDRAQRQLAVPEPPSEDARVRPVLLRRTEGDGETESIGEKRRWQVD